MKKTIFIITAIILISISNGYSQYIHFSQFYATPTLLSPSFAGSAKNSRVILNYRDQWPSIPGTFVTFAAAYDQHFYKIKSGFGVLAVRDQAGSGNLARTDFGVLYSYYFQLDKTTKLFFRPGVQFKISQRSVELQNLLFSDQIQPGFNPDDPPPTIEALGETSKLYLDATASGLFYTERWWAGTTFDHLLRPNESFWNNTITRTEIKFALFAGYKFRVGRSRRTRQFSKDKESITATFYYRYQGGYDQLDFGGYWHHQPFTLGVWLRGLPLVNQSKKFSLDALVFLVGYEIFKFQIGYSYDLTVSNLFGSSGGSHEISLQYYFDGKLIRKQRHEVVPCPKL